MSIYIGDTEISSLHVGDNDIKAVYIGNTEIWRKCTPYQWAPNSAQYNLAWADRTTNLSISPSATAITFRGQGNGISTGYGRSFNYYTTTNIPTNNCTTVTLKCTWDAGYSAAFIIYPPNTTPTSATSSLAETGLKKGTTYTLTIPKKADGTLYEYVTFGFVASAYGPDVESDVRGATITDIKFSK